MSLAILFHFLCAQHISDINVSIIRSLRLCCWITTVLQASACNTGTTQTQTHQISNTQRTENKTTDVVIQQHSRKLLMVDTLMSETCWAYKKWNKIASDIKLVFQSSTMYVKRLAHCNLCTKRKLTHHAELIACVHSLAVSWQKLVVCTQNATCSVLQNGASNTAVSQSCAETFCIKRQLLVPDPFNKDQRR